MIPDKIKKNPNYPFWSLEKKQEYDKTAELIKEHGHVIKGIKELRLGVAYTVGASNSIGAEFISFFPLSGKGFSVIGKIINNLIKLIQNKPQIMKSQIFTDETIYELPFGFIILPEKEKIHAQSEYECQLQRDALLSDFSTDNHDLILLLFSDKYGKMPWEEDCGNFWPSICPRSLVDLSQKVLTGESNFEDRMKKDDDAYYTTIRNVRYPLLVELSPEDLQNGVKLGEKRWMEKYPNGNFKLLETTVISLFNNEVVVTQEGNKFFYFDKNNIPDPFVDDFPNELFIPDGEVRKIIVNKF